VYVPDHEVQQTLTNFIQKFVFFEEKDKSEISEEKSETKMVEEDKEHLEHTKIDDEDEEHGNCVELHKHRNYLAGFCKLVVYNVLPIQSAADVFRHYVKYYNDYGDIIKMALGKAREINTVSCARTMVLSLSILFHDLSRAAGSHIDRQSEDIFSVKV
jgi:cohesin complex subunit SA-1/2